MSEQGGIVAMIARAFKGRDSRLDALEARIATLEQARPAANLADAWKGVYSATEIYARGSLVTYSGALWLGLEDNNIETPGRSQSWKLVVKKHR